MIISALSIQAAKTTNTVAYDIMYWFFVISIVILIVSLVFAIRKGNKNAKEVFSDNDDEMDDVTKYKRDCWEKSLRELSDKSDMTMSNTFIEIVAFHDVKSIYYKYIRLIHYLLLFSFLCFVPGLDKFGRINNLTDAIMTLITTILIFAANVLSDWVSGKVDELADLNCQYEDMKFYIKRYLRKNENSEQREIS